MYRKHWTKVVHNIPFDDMTQHHARWAVDAVIEALSIQNDNVFTGNIKVAPDKKCLLCGSIETEASAVARSLSQKEERAFYNCGSSDYSNMDGSFIQSAKCRDIQLGNIAKTTSVQELKDQK